jgi:hypothetical protein
MKTVMENVNTGDIVEFDETEANDAVLDTDDISDEEFFAFLEEILREMEETVVKK